MPIVTLTTDFGTADHYVAAMKGVILSAAPRCTLVDVTHDIAPGGIVPAAFLLSQLPASFPPGTVHVAVIDPTVGTERALLAARSAEQFFLAPDNGLLSFVLQRWGLEALHTIDPPVGRYVSRTFHGRDVLAPAAALLANRGRLDELGPPSSRMETLEQAEPIDAGDRVEGEVIYVDRFGNCVTNIPQALVRALADRGPGMMVYAGQRRIGRLVRTYADAPTGTPLGLIGSADLLEIAVNMGSAVATLGLSVGSPVTLRME